MNIMIIGAGYIGLVTGTLFADKGNNVVCIDKNKNVVDSLNQGVIHIYESGLKERVVKNMKDKRLSFNTDINKYIQDSDVIFLGVNTPSKENGSFNLDHLFSAVGDVAKALKNCKGYKIIVGKSTVPQGTYKEIISIINNEVKDNHELEWNYVSNPETLAEGSAVRDFLKPDRIIIGTNSDRAFDVMQELYHPFNITQNRVIRGSPSDAELAKLFSNTALALRVAMVNEFSRIADVTPDADMDIIRRMVCEDSRIGYKFMFPGPGYGGSCFPKDIQGVVSKSIEDGYKPLLLSQIHKSNELHKEYLADKVINTLGKNKKLAIWGLTFKPNTDDMRDSSSLIILNKLIENGYEIAAYDPKDSKAREIFKDKINFVDEPYDACFDCDGLMLLTEWPIFDSVDYNKLSKIMKGNYLFDFRNRWLGDIAKEKGFNYFGVGRHYG